MDLRLRKIKSARSAGSVGPMAIVPRLIEKWHPKGTILDYGAGPKAIHAERLRKQGLNVTAYELPPNHDPKLHDLNSLTRKYDVVYASNVINVQENKRAAAKVVTELSRLIKAGGSCVLNLPYTPNYPELTFDELKEICSAKFEQVHECEDELVGKNRVLICTNIHHG